MDCRALIRRSILLYCDVGIKHMVGYGEVECQIVPRRPYIPHRLPLCCNYPVQKCPSALVVVTSILRVKNVALDYW